MVEAAKAEARENDDIVSRSLVLNMIKQQKKKEAQVISEAVLDAEVRIGELMSLVPKTGNGGANQYKAKTTPVSGEQTKLDPGERRSIRTLASDRVAGLIR